MKLLKEGKERKWYLVKEWVTRAGLRARINQCVWNDEIKKIAPSMTDHYTGYVHKRLDDTKQYYDSDTDVHGGVTFEDAIEGEEGIWVGFDMAHLWDEKIPDQLEYAEQECEKLAKQMV